MSSVLTVKAKLPGRKKPLIDDWTIPLVELDLQPPTLRTLIAQVVLDEVKGFRERQAARKLTRILTQTEIDASVAQGKVDMGGRDVEQAVNAQEAVANAWQAFDDGLYLVLLDGMQLQTLDDAVTLTDASQLTFVRLVALAGG